MEKKRIYILLSLFTSGFLMILFMFLENDTLTWLFLLIMFALLGYLIFYNSNEQKTMIDNYIKETDNYISSNNIEASKSVFSDTASSRIIFDHEHKNIHILKYRQNPVLIPYSKIIESELIENGSITITKTSRGSQLGGAIIGGVLAGGVGAIIGGLSGNTKSSKEIKKLELKIVSDDLYSPVNSFYIKDSINDYDKGSVLYKRMYDTAYELQKTISLIIKDNS